MGGQQTRPLYNICLAHFLKTNLWKYADISVKRRQKAEAFWDRQLQNHTNEGKGKQKKKERGGRKEEKRKSNFFIMATLQIFQLAENTVGRKRSIWL